MCWKEKVRDSNKTCIDVSGAQRKPTYYSLVEFKLIYVTSIAKQAFILYQLRLMSDSWRLNKKSRCLCGKIINTEPAHHVIRTRDLWYERPTLYHWTTVSISIIINPVKKELPVYPSMWILLYTVCLETFEAYSANGAAPDLIAGIDFPHSFIMPLTIKTFTCTLLQKLHLHTYEV